MHVPHFPRSRAVRTGLLLLIACAAAPAGATILSFDQAAAAGGRIVPTFSGGDLPAGYGDRVSGPTATVPGGEYTYGEGGEGYTPNVEVDVSTAANGYALWVGGYGDITNVLFGDNNSQALRLSFVADPGYEALLFGFDLAGYLADWTIRSVSVVAGGTTLFSASDVLVEGDANGPRRTRFDFGAGLRAQDLLLTIDYGNLLGGRHDNIGIDGVRFGQAGGDGGPGDPVPVPEPGTHALAALGLGLALLARRRSRHPGAGARPAPDAGSQSRAVFQSS